MKQIYLDNACTTFPKPPSVPASIAEFIFFLLNCSIWLIKVFDESINTSDNTIKPANTTDKIKWSIFDLVYLMQYLRPTTMHKVMLKIMENIL